MPTLTVCSGALRFKEIELATGAGSSFFSAVTFFPFPFFRVEEMVISFRHHCHWWLSNPHLSHRPFFLLASLRFWGMPLSASASCSLINLGVPLPAAGVVVFPLAFFPAGPSSFFSCASEA